MVPRFDLSCCYLSLFLSCKRLGAADAIGICGNMPKHTHRCESSPISYGEHLLYEARIFRLCSVVHNSCGLTTRPLNPC